MYLSKNYKNQILLISNLFDTYMKKNLTYEHFFIIFAYFL